MASPTSTPGLHREIEDKLDADTAFELPDLSDLPGVTGVGPVVVEELDAVYLDSADLGLARHDITLRHRTGGDDAGWHLKLPDPKRGRLEVRRPSAPTGAAPDDLEVPADLLALLRVQLRGAPVRPVARITTRRSVRRLFGPDDVVLAEVADDTVEAGLLGSPAGPGTAGGPSGPAGEPQAWREIEVELVDGDDTLLAATADRLVAAGARPATSTSKLRRVLLAPVPGSVTPSASDPANGPGAPEPADTTAVSAVPAREDGGERAERWPAGDVVVTYLAEQVRALIAEDPRVRLDADDAIHQMRVSTRRLRTTLATFRSLFARGSAEPLRAELKWLADLLGAARDVEVMRASLTSAIAGQPGELVLGPVQRRVDLELGPAYRQAHERAVAALDGDRYLRLVADLETFVADPPFSDEAAQPARTQLRRSVRKAGRRLTRARAALGAGAARTDAATRAHLDEQLHEVRIAAKRCRYAAETVRPVFGRKAKALASAMEQIQETLGDHQDAVVERGWLRDFGIRSFLAGENGFTFGRLHGLTEARARHDEKEFTRVWKNARRVLASWPG
jgi:CHAD domain-containing protein